MFGIVLISLANVQGALIDDIVSYYKFDEQDTTGSGTIYDELGTNNGTNQGTDNSSGLIETAYDYVSASTDYITLPASLQPTFDSDFTISLWVNPDTDGDNRVFFTSRNTASPNQGLRVLRLGANLNVIFDFGASDKQFTTTSAITTGNWYHIVARRSGTNVSIWLNGVMIDSASEVGYDTNMSAPLDCQVGIKEDKSSEALDGILDELGIWERGLSDDEIEDLYNSGTGLSYPFGITEISITLDSPDNETVTSNTSLTLEATYNITGTTTNWTNVTYEIWHSNGTVWNNTHNVEITYQNNFTSELFANFSIGEYLWNVKAYVSNATGSFIQRATKNYTFTVAGAFSDFIFDSPVVETSSQTFHVLLEIPKGTTIQAGSGKLNYNGTDYASITATDLGSNQFNLSRTIYIPAGTSGFNWENRSFFWNITVVDTTSGNTFTQTSDSYNQNVTELKFGLCSASLTIPMLNFTLYDENLGTVINATANAVTFQTTFKIGGYWDFMNKTVAINNLSVAVSEFDFCTNSPTNIFYTSAELFYNAVGFTGKNYYLTNATLTNTTNEINLYLLNESDSIEFFVSVEQDLSPVTSAQVTVQKYFVGEGVFKTVEIDETSSDTGEFTAYFDLDKDYKFVITKDGTVLGTVTKTASCKEAPCEMIISLTSAEYDIYSVWGDEFAGNVLYNLSYNPTTKIVTFDFIDTTGLANYFRMQTYEGKFNQSKTLIFDTTTYSSSGTITANLSTYDKGNFVVYTYVSRSPEILIDYLRILISNLAGTFGILGLFLAFLLVITIIFGLSHSPPTLIISVPLSLTIAQSIGILSLSWTAIILVWVLSLIAFWAVSK